MSFSWMPLTPTSLAATMVVNILTTGMIVFKILKVLREVKAASASIDRNLGSAGGISPSSRHRQIIFVILESGMMLLVIQLLRMVLFVNIGPGLVTDTPGTVYIVYNYFIAIGEMFNVIIRSVHFYFFCFTEFFLPD